MTPQTENPPMTSEIKPLNTRSRAALEALLMTADRPLKGQAIIDPLNLLDPDSESISQETLDASIDALNEEYESTHRSFRIERVAAGYRIMTLPEHAPVVAAMHRARAGTRLTRTQLETLSIIAADRGERFYRGDLAEAQVRLCETAMALGVVGVDLQCVAVLDHCLAILPAAEFDRMADALEEQVAAGDVDVNALRAFASQADEVVPDSQGRVRLRCG